MRNFRAAHADESLDLRDIRDRHDARDDRRLDAHRPGVIAESIEFVVVEEKLRDDEARAVIDLTLEMLQIARAIEALRMAFGISRNADAEIVPLAHEFDQLIRISKAALRGHELTLPLWRIPAQ